MVDLEATADRPDYGPHAIVDLVVRLEYRHPPQRLNAARVLVKSVAVCGQTGERSGVQCACIESHVSQHAVERVLCPIPDPERRIVVQIQWLAVGIEEAMTPERPHHTRLARAAKSDGVIGLS